MKHHPGFTLIEMAVVLTIIGLLVGSLLVPLTTQIDNAKIQSTTKTLAEIKTALINYATANNRLPCPALKPETGEAVAIGDALCQQQGYLPWASLGTHQYDAWGGHLWYRTNPSYTERDGLAQLAVTSSSLTIKVEPATMIEDVVAIIFSYGKNRQYAANSFKFLGEIILPSAVASGTTTLSDNSITDNCPAGKVCYTKSAYIPNGFDDNLIWLSRTTLVEQLVSTGKLQTKLTTSPSLDLPTVNITLPTFNRSISCDTYDKWGDCVSSLSNQTCEQNCPSLKPSNHTESK